MRKSATDVMEEIVFSAVIDAIAAFKTASKGMPNTLLRDLAAVHANTTLADLPNEVQVALSAGVRSAFGRLRREGFTVASSDAIPTHPAPSRASPAGARRGPAPGGSRRPPRPKR